MLEAVIRLRFPLLVLIAFCGVGGMQAGALRINGIPSKRMVIIQMVPQNEAVAKLPPPVAPGMEQSQSISTSTLPPGVEIEKIEPAVQPVEPKELVPEVESAQKLKIKAERKRLNDNAVVWQLERAAGGSATAMRSLGMRYRIGDGVEKDEAKGMDLLRKASEGGDTAAKKELAKLEAAKKELGK